QEALARYDQKSFLMAFAVVQPHRLARLQDVEGDAELPERPLPLEVAELAELPRVAPTALARVVHEPSRSVRAEPELRAARRGLGDHHVARVRAQQTLMPRSQYGSRRTFPCPSYR